jgi:putative ABC transport system substrate-binding protein
MALRAREIRTAAEQIKIALFDAGAQSLDELEARFATLSKQQPLAVVVTADRSRKNIGIVFSISWCAMPFRQCTEARFVEGGGLISYGASVRDFFRRSASYVDKILKGAKPANLPVEQPRHLPGH